MGSHRVGLFDDDDGSDFAVGILRRDQSDVVEDTLKVIPTEDWEYGEYPEGVRALLAAEPVASRLGHESDDLPDDLRAWAQQFGEAELARVALAKSAVDRVVRCSKTRDFWSDSWDF